MSILGNIMSSIFGHATQSTSSMPAGSMPAGKPAAALPATQAQVDVEAVLTKLANQNAEKLDWRKSIVDLMKLLNLDSSLSARKELAHELHYAGDTNNSATMNVWLHGQVMIRLAEHGGKVPAELRGGLPGDPKVPPPD